MDADELIDTLAQGFEDGTTALLCGAGVSVPSGLPQVGGEQGMVWEVLRLTALAEHEMEFVANAVLGSPKGRPYALPFERFMETLLDKFHLMFGQSC